MVKFDEYPNYDALGLADLVRRGEISVPELVDSALRAIDTLNLRLNAVVRILADAARSAACNPISDGPLCGVPFMLKDTGVSLAGIPTEYGSRYFKGYTRGYDSEIVRRYKRAGLIIVGKTNCSEVGTSCSADTVATGSMHNPWDLERIAGISSGGSAAAVAAGIVPAAHATDAGGSIRGPAAWCGLVGLKPTRGRISYAPDAGEHWSGLATQHVVSRSVRDSAAILDCTAGPVPGDPYSAPIPEQAFLAEVTTDPGVLRVGFAVEGPNGMKFEDETRSSLIRTARLMEQLGHQVQEASPRWDAALMGEAMGCIAASALLEATTQREVETGVPPSTETLEHANWTLLAQGRKLSALDLTSARKKINTISRSFATFFETFDVWLTPTMGNVAPPHGYLDSCSPDVALLTQRFSELYRFNSIYNASGLPAITLPLHSSRGGLPIGMMFGAGFGKEGLLFRLAGQLERATPWNDRHPLQSLWTALTR
jgi:Asp-tRNA(Asn)/Glu-tRNA(Gln) amidotransferase A subunit family amidase